MVVVTGEAPGVPAPGAVGAVVVVTLGGGGFDRALLGGGVVGEISWLPNNDTNSSWVAGCETNSTSPHGETDAPVVGSVCVASAPGSMLW